MGKYMTKNIYEKSEGQLTEDESIKKNHVKLAYCKM